MCKTIKCVFASLRIVDSDLEAVIEKNDLLDKVESVVNNLYWYDKEMLWLYVNLGSYRAIEQETGIPWEACYKRIKIVTEDIRQTLLGNEVKRSKYTNFKGQRKLEQYVKRA
jgi:hypothetical protein